MVDVDALADRLRMAAATRTPIAPLTVTEPALDLPTAYAVQQAQRPADAAGWKLGITSRAKQVQVGLDSAVHAALDAADALDPGEPLEVSQLIQPRAEPEIVFVLGCDLAGPHVRAADVLAASSSVAVGLEILDSRFHDYRFTMADVVADRVSAARHLVGDPLPPTGLDLRLVGVVMEKNGVPTATASGAASLGHPAAAVAWLVRRLAAEGEGLHAGQIVLSGGLTAAVPVDSGDVVTATIDRLGSLTLSCR
ncbi:2-keto-4-pentenoate hydratase [Actinomadura nitritigenes]|uniref:2-keto-4-pentenoate hydratase n=1 Tax=Actinomadura nitritigenes TaxID=134602 RepID=UPI003D945D09